MSAYYIEVHLTASYITSSYTSLEAFKSLTSKSFYIAVVWPNASRHFTKAGCFGTT